MRKKKHIVLARNEKIAAKGLELDGKKMNFHQGKAFWVEDEGKVRALQQKYSRDIAVTLDQQYTWHANNERGNGTRMDNTHNYTFQGVDTSHFKVWVEVKGKPKRVTKAEALRKGYPIISDKKRYERRKGVEVDK